MSFLKQRESLLPTSLHLSPWLQSRAIGCPGFQWPSRDDSSLSFPLEPLSIRFIHGWVSVSNQRHKSCHPLYSFPPLPEGTGQNASTSLHADKLSVDQSMGSDLSESQNTIFEWGILFHFFIKLSEMGVSAMKNKTIPVRTERNRKHKRNNLKE